MTIYNPERYRSTDQTLIRKVIDRYNFATIMVSPAAGEIVISHLPLFFQEKAGTPGILVGHMARSNPQWRHFSGSTKVNVIFHGPHAYVSPRWYEPAADNVPTWNYAVVHIDGMSKIISEPEAAFVQMTELVSRHDPDWPLNLPDAEKRGLMAGIVVFEIAIVSMEGKFKLSQNQIAGNRHTVIKELLSSSNQVDRETGELMMETSLKC